METPSALFGSWASFFMIVGSSAGALTGLMFIVVTLVAERTDGEPNEDANAGVNTFSTPTVVHFSTALLLSAMMSAPWHSFARPGVFIVIAAVTALVYMGRITLAMQQRSKISEYQFVIEDWIWYALLPVVAYGAMAAGGFALAMAPQESMFVLGGSALLLVFIGIHNSWDVVTFLALQGRPPRSGGGDSA